MIAIVSFILGTLCLLLFKTNNDYGFIAIGYFYILLATAINSIMLLTVIINSVRCPKDYQEHLKTIFLVLLNIPIVIVYLEIV